MSTSVLPGADQLPAPVTDLWRSSSARERKQALFTVLVVFAILALIVASLV